VLSSCAIIASLSIGGQSVISIAAQTDESPGFFQPFASKFYTKSLAVSLSQASPSLVS
jgi:hypothetical protein